MMEHDALAAYAGDMTLSVSKHAIEQAIRTLLSADKNLEALTLVRAAFHEADGGYATLEHGRIILRAIEIGVIQQNEEEVEGG